MIRSRRVSRMRVTMVAIVSQPNPSTIGMTALPFKQIVLEEPVDQHRQAGQVARSLEHGKCQEECSDDGEVSATAYVTPRVQTP